MWKIKFLDAGYTKYILDIQAYSNTGWTKFA